MACEKYCKGGMNTEWGLIAKDLDPEMFDKTSHAKFVQVKTKKGYLCPHGCNANPANENKARNLIKNSGIKSICLNNPFRYLTLD